MSGKTPIIIVKKKRGGHHGHHGGAWKVAYADFVTAMMAFFLVLWIVGQSQKVKDGVAGYFRNPGVLQYEHSTGILPGSMAGISPDITVEQPEKVKEEEVEAAVLEKSAERIKEMLSQVPEFERLQDQIEIRATPEGMRIELIDSSEATFFDSASAVLKPATERILAIIGRELNTLGLPIVVEGHTDSRPFSTREGYTNWELSADRANAARRQMERTGLDRALLRAVRGFADKQLANDGDPFDARNRRVSIVVVANVVKEKTGQH